MLLRPPAFYKTLRRLKNLPLITLAVFSVLSFYFLIVSFLDATQPMYNVNFTRNQSYDNWPQMPYSLYPKPIPRSPYTPTKPVYWSYDVSSFLQRPDVTTQPPKIITWMVKPRYWPQLPELVRLRVCPDMPCRITTNLDYQKESAALMWAGQIMRDDPPKRSHPDQMFVFHNDEPQKADWIDKPSFRRPAWKSEFNWTMTYRSDSDFVTPYAVMEKREVPVTKNYTNILSKKTKLAAWLVSVCETLSKREDFIKELQKYIPVDVYGSCGNFNCPRSHDDACFDRFSTQYKFYMSMENSFCEDYVSEKFFRYLETDTVVVTRGSGHKKKAAEGTYINTEDFSSIEDLAKYLLYLDSHPEEYIKILKSKDKYVPLYEDYPIRDHTGAVDYMEYHYESVPLCEMCLKLWNIQDHRAHIPNFNEWFDKGVCQDPPDLAKFPVS